LYVDKYARLKKKKPFLELKTFYGQIQHVILVKMPATQDLSLSEPDTLVLASIRNCDVVEKRTNGLGMRYYKKEGYTEVVDIGTIQCLVGRIFDRNWWTIIDRSAELARLQILTE
jgi:hypothetical protein